MAVYLLNATLVWLLSALLYETLFRRETVHAWNRAYLLVTLALGFVLPLLRWERSSALTYEARPVAVAVAQITAVKTALLPVASGEAGVRVPAEPSRFGLLLVIYCAIAALLFGRMLWEAFRIVRLYRQGTKTFLGTVTLVETGSSHGPFSFFRLIFISGSADYDEEELRFVLQHEQRHAALLHSADMLLLQFLCALFWSHPLLYWYRHRLRLVHEYQADERSRPQAASYGRFLVAQALLQAPPPLSHSFQQSPLKNRIAMLIRPQSAGLRLARYVLVLPLLVALMLGCTHFESASQRRQEGNLVYFNGNTIEMTVAPFTEMEKKMLAKNPGAVKGFPRDSVPYKLNGALVYDSGSWTQAPRFKGKGTPLEAIVQSLSSSLTKLPNGKYMLVVDDAVLNEKGQLVYYDIAPVSRAFGAIETDPGTGEKVFSMRIVLDNDSAARIKPEHISRQLDAGIVAAISADMEKKLDGGLEFSPAMVNGKPVPALITPLLGLNMIYDVEVKNGKIGLVKNAGAQWNELVEETERKKHH